MTPTDRHPLRRPWVRLWLASALFSFWMLFLLVGWAAGGTVHLMLVAALVLFPWRDEAGEDRQDGAAGTQSSSSAQPGDC